MTHSYRQVVKERVRERMLGSAIKALTVGRPLATIVLSEELNDTINFAVDTLKNADIKTDVDAELHVWSDGFSQFARPKKPSDLKVLYLCGPEPLNDLRILLKQGIVPQNV